MRALVVFLTLSAGMAHAMAPDPSRQTDCTSSDEATRDMTPPRAPPVTMPQASAAPPPPRLERLALADLAIDERLQTSLRLAGAIGLVAGAVAVGGGTFPAWMYSQTRGELGRATTAYVADGTDGTNGTGAAGSAARLHRDALDAKAAYNDGGRWIVASGLAVAVVGGAVLGTSFLLPTLPAEGDAGGKVPP